MMKTKMRMIQRWIKIIFGKTNASVNQGLGKVYSINTIKGYYSDMTGKVEKGCITDNNGIPIINIGENERVYFPIDIMNYGLAYYDLYLMGKGSEYRDKFFLISKWCINNMSTEGAWNCFSPVKSKKYTVSSLGQGLGASLFIRAYMESKEEKYIIAAKKAIDFMLKPVEEGGTSIYSGKDLYLEEYPNQQEKRSVLNGWIFSIFGLYDYYLLTKDKEYYHTLIKTKNTLIRTLKLYDMGFWNYYDLEKMIASPHYQKIHYCLLEVLFNIFQNDFELFQYSQKWKKQYNNCFYKTVAVFLKIFQKIFIEEVEVVSID